MDRCVPVMMALVACGVPVDAVRKVGAEVRVYDRGSSALLIVSPSRFGTFAVRCYPDRAGSKVRGLDGVRAFESRAGVALPVFVRASGRRVVLDFDSVRFGDGFHEPR